MFENILKYENIVNTNETDFVSYLLDIIEYGKNHPIRIPDNIEDVVKYLKNTIEENLLERKEVTNKELIEFNNTQMMMYIVDNGPDTKDLMRRLLLHPGVYSYGTAVEAHLLKNYSHKVYMYPQSSKIISSDGIDRSPLLHVVKEDSLIPVYQKAVVISYSILTKDNIREYYYIIDQILHTH